MSGRSLDTAATYASDRSYVLKLHRDAAPSEGRLQGRLIHVASGDLVDFADGQALLAWVESHAAAWSR